MMGSSSLDEKKTKAFLAVLLGACLILLTGGILWLIFAGDTAGGTSEETAESSAVSENAGNESDAAHSAEAASSQSNGSTAGGETGSVSAISADLAERAAENTMEYDEQGNAMTADPANFALNGRFLIREEEDGVHYITVWTAASVSFTFHGTDAWCYLSGETDTGPMKGVYAGVYIDDAREPASVLNLTEEGWYPVAEGLPAGDHTIRIIRHSEAFGGRFEFMKIKVSDPGYLCTPPKLPELKMEIIGDSITAGYGNLAEKASDPFRLDQENGLLAYGALLADKLGARAHILAWSGIGVLQNNDGRSINTMPKIYELTAPGVNRTRWDFSGYQPDLILVNLGTNDMASGADAALFRDSYIRFIGLIRANNPNAKIFCTMGIMGTRLVPAMEEAVEKIRQDGDSRVYCIPLAQQRPENGYGADGHPSLATHREVAEELYKAILKYMESSSGNGQ